MKHSLLIGFRQLPQIALVAALAATTVACADATTEPSAGQAQLGLGDPGALVGATLQGQVGVKLDEIPIAMRGRIAADLIAKPTAFWTDRAKAQLQLTSYRLVFRQDFYGLGTKKMQLPLPPESRRNVTLTSAPKRATVGGHDYVVVNYRLNSTLVTDPASPATSEAKLAKVGGSWDEPFTLPIDPELLFQRTGYACMDEEDFPPNSVESEEVESFYDHECTTEKELSPRGCHQTNLPTQSCKQALAAHVGAYETVVRFTRLKWDRNLANQARVGTAAPGGADLSLELEEFLVNRVTYRYIAAGACELSEQCVGGSGWRRLLQFATSDRNVGDKALHIGDVDYYLTGTQTLNDKYHIFQFDQCHQHYHFAHYGNFTFGGDAEMTAKRGFCLQSTARPSNHEKSPLHNPYGGCETQGVEVGWVDQYKAGLPCQWIDVTDIDTTQGAVTKDLGFISNPDGFLCEGTPILDASGNPVFEPTQFTTANGQTVYRAKCNFSANWQANNGDAYPATVPTPGNGYVTLPCSRGQIGPLRNCGWRNLTKKVACTPGQTTTLSCTVTGKPAAQVLRVCEFSSKLGTGTACVHQDALASQVVDGSATISFKCPAARDASEPGGAVALYDGAAYPGDGTTNVKCVVVP